jgi:ABC-type bacteriocin/lantibiotic exporter with double-glycine peptidase domain
VKLLQDRVKAELGWLEVMSDNMLNWRLVSAYQMNGLVCTQFKHTYENFYKKHRKSRFYQTNCEWIPRFINELILAFVFVMGTMLCCEGQLTVGEFTALVSIFKRIGKKVLLLNRCVVRMIRSSVALYDLAELLNMETGIQEQVRKCGRRECSIEDESAASKTRVQYRRRECSIEDESAVSETRVQYRRRECSIEDESAV